MTTSHTSPLTAEQLRKRRKLEEKGAVFLQILESGSIRFRLGRYLVDVDQNGHEGEKFSLA